MKIEDAVVLIIGATGLIGRALAFELVRRRVHGLALVDDKPGLDDVVTAVNASAGDWVSWGFSGDLEDPDFRASVYRETAARCGTVNVCVPIIVPITVRADVSSRCLRAEARRVARATMTPVTWADEMVDVIARHRADHGLGPWSPDEHEQGIVVIVRTGSDVLPRCLPDWRELGHCWRSAAAVLVPKAQVHGVRCNVISRGNGTGWSICAVGDHGPAAVQARSLRPLPVELIANAICFMMDRTKVDTWCHNNSATKSSA